MRLYQGSNIVIDNINLAMCRPYKDFKKYEIVIGPVADDNMALKKGNE